MAIDLFSGAGGLAEGFESAGVRVAAAVELHPQPALTHALNHPDTDVYAGDIRELDLGLIEDSVRSRSGRPGVDIIFGGPPCQGFSTAGKRRAADPRNNLFVEFARVVERFRPAVFLLENVPGFKQMHGGAAYAEATKLFGRLGYHTTDTILQAAEHGAPQRRRRFVMVGVIPGACGAVEWPQPTHVDSALASGTLEGEKPVFVTAEEALEDIAFLEPGWEAHRHSQPARFSYARARRGGSELLFNHLATRHRPKAVELFERIGEGQTIKSVPKDERPAKATMVRLARARVANAVVGLPDDMLHYAHHRIPTVREMARLQTFDDDYVFVGKRTSGFMERRVDVPQYTQVGNAVPPLLGRALGRVVLNALKAPVQDLRDISGRRARHAWVRGSSGYSGYTLGPTATVSLFDAVGTRLELPISDEEAPVVSAEFLSDWTARPRSRRRQWVPGVRGPEPNPGPA